MAEGAALGAFRSRMLATPPCASANAVCTCSTLPLSAATSGRYDAASDGPGIGLELGVRRRRPGACAGQRLVCCRGTRQGRRECGIWPYISSGQNLTRSSGHLTLYSPLASFNRLAYMVSERSATLRESNIEIDSRGSWSKTSSSKVSVRVLQTSASRKDGGKSRSGEEDEKKEEKEGKVLKTEGEDKSEGTIDEQVKKGKNVGGRTIFSKTWWPLRVQSKADVDAKPEQVEEVAETKVDEIEGEEQASAAQGDYDHGESNWESQEEVGEADAREVENIDQSESASFWRRILFWKRKDVPEDAEDDILLRDLENLTFNWKLFFDPSPGNVVALIFTILLLVAFFNIFMQLLLVVMTIILEATKYTVLAALTVGFLIFLL